MRETSQYAEKFNPRDPRWLAAVDVPAEDWTEEAIDALAADVYAETSLHLEGQTDEWQAGWHYGLLESVPTIRRAYAAGFRDAEQPHLPMLGVALGGTLALIAGIVIGVALASVVG